MGKRRMKGRGGKMIEEKMKEEGRGVGGQQKRGEDGRRGQWI